MELRTVTRTSLSRTPVRALSSAAHSADGIRITGAGRISDAPHHRFVWSFSHAAVATARTGQAGLMTRASCTAAQEGAGACGVRCRGPLPPAADPRGAGRRDRQPLPPPQPHLPRGPAPPSPTHAHMASMRGGVGSPPKPVSPKSLAPARKQEQACTSASHRAVRRKQEARAYKGVARAAHRNTTLAWPRTAAGRAMSTNLGATAMPGRKRMDACKQVAREEMRALTRAGIDQRRANAAADKLEHE